MIGELYEALAAVLAVWADKSTARYKPAADGFSFDAEPRADLTAYYVEPAQTRQAAGYVGGGGLDVAMVTIWASLEARDQAAAGLALANDLQRRAGLCYWCPAPALPGRRMCSTCADLACAKSRQLRAERIAAGRCSRCGGPGQGCKCRGKPAPSAPAAAGSLGVASKRSKRFGAFPFPPNDHHHFYSIP